MFQLEKMSEVVSYVKNDHLNFEIQYEFEGNKFQYRPDYLIHLEKNDRSILNIILEVKGFEREKDRSKIPAIKRWADAVNYHGEFGKWTFITCRDPNKVTKALEKLVES